MKCIVIADFNYHYGGMYHECHKGDIVELNDKIYPYFKQYLQEQKIEQEPAINPAHDKQYKKGIKKGR